MFSFTCTSVHFPSYTRLLFLVSQVDSEYLKMLEEQKRKREELIAIKEANRRKAAEGRRTELERRLSEKGL